MASRTRPSVSELTVSPIYLRRCRLLAGTASFVRAAQLSATPPAVLVTGRCRRQWSACCKSSRTNFLNSKAAVGDLCGCVEVLKRTSAIVNFRISVLFQSYKCVTRRQGVGRVPDACKARRADMCGVQISGRTKPAVTGHRTPRSDSRAHNTSSHTCGAAPLC